MSAPDVIQDAILLSAKTTLFIHMTKTLLIYYFLLIQQIPRLSVYI